MPSSSSVGLCGSFVNGTTRLHYGEQKAQFCDERDGKKYVYVTIDTHTWMAENLNYRGTELDTLGKCYNEDPTYCTTYGRLYNWTVAATEACPMGWHLPSQTEWNVLIKVANPSCSDDSDCAGVGTKLKATSWNGTDSTAASLISSTDIPTHKFFSRHSV